MEGMNRITQAPSPASGIAPENPQSSLENAAIQSQMLSVSAANNDLSRLPITRALPSPAGIAARIYTVPRARHDYPGLNNYLSITRRYHHIAETDYMSLIQLLYDKNDGRDGYPWQNLATRSRNVPHGMISRFNNQIRQTLVLQGFLWPGWDQDWLIPSGTSTVRVQDNYEMREIMPDAVLRLVNHEQPFLIVEVIASTEYHETLEKTRWILSNSKGKIRFAIVIVLVREPAVPVAEGGGGGAHGEPDYPDAVADSNKRAFRELSVDSSPSKENKRARAGEPSVSLPGQHKKSRDSTTNREDVTTTSHSSSSRVPSSTLNEVPDSAWADLFPLAPEAGGAGVLPSSSAVRNDPTYRTGMPSSSSNGPRAPPPRAPPPSPAQPNRNAIYAAAYVTVLSTAKTYRHREVTTLLNLVEFWPKLPGQEDVFSFGWEDMPVSSFPDSMGGRRFTISFEPLYRSLDLFVKIGDQGWVEEHQGNMAMEYTEEEDASSEEGASEAEILPEEIGVYEGVVMERMTVDE